MFILHVLVLCRGYFRPLSQELWFATLSNRQSWETELLCPPPSPTPPPPQPGPPPPEASQKHPAGVGEGLWLEERVLQSQWGEDRGGSLQRAIWGQKNPLSVREIFVRNSGAGNGCANFMGACEKCVRSAGKNHFHKIPRFRGGGVFRVFGGGGGEVPILFLWARGFF